jgi:hypothetical protein
MESDPLARFVALEHERRKLEGRLEDIGKEAGALQDHLLNDWAERGQQSANVDGLCVYIARDFYCSKRKEFSTEQIIDVLKAAGLERCIQIGYNASSLKAFVKEQLAAGSDVLVAKFAVGNAEQAVQLSLADCINYDTVPRLRTRAS